MIGKPEPAPESEPGMQAILRQDLHDLQDKVGTLNPGNPVNPVDPVLSPTGGTVHVSQVTRNSEPETRNFR